MLGDIVSSNTNPNSATATAVKPADPVTIAQPSTGGYGSSSFGMPKQQPIQAAAPRTVAAAQFQSQAQPQAIRPVASQATAQVAARPTVPIVEKASVEPLPEVAAALKPAKGRTPFVLTVVGVLIFIGGVSGLFIYALNGS